MFDVWIVKRSEGYLIARFEAHRRQSGHVHIADVTGGFRRGTIEISDNIDPVVSRTDGIELARFPPLTAAARAGDLVVTDDPAALGLSGRNRREFRAGWPGRARARTPRAAAAR